AEPACASLHDEGHPHVDPPFGDVAVAVGLDLDVVDLVALDALHGLGHLAQPAPDGVLDARIGRGGDLDDFSDRHGAASGGGRSRAGTGSLAAAALTRRHGAGTVAAVTIAAVLASPAMNPAPNLVLVGPMGAGKTSIGRRLAERFGLAFVDADHYVEERTGATIAAIFEHVGEAGFRERERAALAELLAGEGRLVATGGGAVLDADNRRLMRERGFVVYLQVGLEAQLRRLG